MTEPLPRPRRFRWRWLVLIGFLACLTGWLLVRPDQPRIVFTLSNGEQIAYRAAGLGEIEHNDHPKVYRWCYGMLAKYAPAALVKQLPAPRVTKLWNARSITGAASLILFFERRSSPQSTPRRGSFDEFIKLEFEDANGHRFPGEIGSRAQYADGRELMCFDAFPRRDRKFMVHMSDPADKTKTTRFEIDLPGDPGDFPDWSPLELPQTKSDSSIDVTLRKLDAGSGVKETALPLDVAIRDPAWERHVVTSRLEDATGNHGNHLSPFETAWKARVTIARTDPTVFLPEDQWKLGPFPVPPVGTKATIQQSKEINGIRFIVQSVEFGSNYTPRGPQATPNASGVRPNMTPEEAATAERTFRVDISGPASSFYLIARVDDQGGEQLTQINHPFSTRGPSLKSAHGVRFKPRSDTTHVTLTLIASQPKEFEFLFGPPSELKTRSDH